MTLRGFATLSPERMKEIATKGGKSVKPENRSFSKNKELASAAGKIGGKNVPKEKRSFSKNKEAAAKAGRLGGITKHGRTFDNREYAAECGRKGGLVTKKEKDE